MDASGSYNSLNSGPFVDGSGSLNANLSGINSSGTSWSPGDWNGSGSTQNSLYFAGPVAENHNWLPNADADILDPSINANADASTAVGLMPNGFADVNGGTSSSQSLSNHLAEGYQNASPGALSPANKELLAPLLQRCLQGGREPFQREIQGLALCEGIAAAAIEAWLTSSIRDHNRAQAENGPIHTRGTSSRADHLDNLRSEEEILQLVREYARQRFTEQCFSTQSRRSAENGGAYECTSGCGYATSRRDSWQRHEQLWQPQEFWCCILCRGQKQKPVICSRKGKILEHFDHCHKEVLKDEQNQLRERSKINHEAGFERTCKFWNGGGLCRYRFKDWNDRIKHYLEHFTNKIHDGPWRLHYHRKRWFDDDEDDEENQGSWPSGAHGAMKSGRFEKSQQTSSRTCSGEKRLMSTGASENLSLGSSASNAWQSLPHGRPGSNESSETLPRRLINVSTLSWSHVNTASKYVALDALMTGDFSLGITHPELASEYGCESGLQQLNRTCLPFREACSIVSNMGYDCLWIEELCEGAADAKHIRTLYERAVLTIVLVPSPIGTNNISQISHFTCNYQDIDQVRAWAVNGLSVLHVQNLGHGSFGIVDEVRLGETSDLYARKMLLEPKAHRLRKATQFREIEIMQKLRHENIARFVAAYSDRRSWNILMRPVAEYSLREFLAEPSSFPDKLPYVARWFCSLASAVSYMHGLSFKHKDIKPANILIRGCDVYLADFGMARDFSLTDSRSSGDALMTPKYCAPEVAHRLGRGRSADIFSLGCVFIELITVELGSSLDDLDRFLTCEDDSSRPKVPYCGRLQACQNWTEKLLNQEASRYQYTCIRMAKQMISRDPTDRPSAQDVHDVLLGAATLLPPSTYEDKLLACLPRQDPSVLSAQSRKHSHISQPDIKSSSAVGVKALHLAVAHGNSEMAACLLQQRMDGDELDHKVLDITSTPLQLAAAHGESLVLSLLLRQGLESARHEQNFRSDLFASDQMTTARWFRRGWIIQELLAPGQSDPYLEQAASMDQISQMTERLHMLSSLQLILLTATSLSCKGSVLHSSKACNAGLLLRCRGMCSRRSPLRVGRHCEYFHRAIGSHLELDGLDDGESSWSIDALRLEMTVSALAMAMALASLADLDSIQEHPTQPSETFSAIPLPARELHKLRSCKSVDIQSQSGEEQRFGKLCMSTAWLVSGV